MAQIVIPAQSDLALALREPNLLVPGRQPVGSLEVKPSGLLADICYLSLQNSGYDLATGRTGTLTGGSLSAGGILWSNTANQGLSYGTYAPITGNQQTFLVVSDIQAQASQRNCVVNQRHSNGPYIGCSFNVATSLVTIESGSFALTYFTGSNPERGGRIQNAITGKTSAYAIARNVTTYSGAVDGQIKTVTEANVSTHSAPTDSPEFNIGDLGSFSSTGYGMQNRTYLIAVWNRALSDVELRQITQDPYGSLFKPANDAPYLLSIPGASGSGTTTVTLSGDILSITDGTLTVQANEDTNVSLTGTTLTIADGTLSVQADVNTDVSLSGDSLTISDGTLSVQADNNTDVTLAGDTLTITDGTLTVQADVDTDVTLVGDSLAISDGTLGVQANVDTSITLSGDTLTISDGTLGIAAGSNISVALTPDTITISDGTLTVNAEVNTTVTLVGDTLAISEGTLTVQADVDTVVSLSGDTVTIIDGSLGVDVTRQVNLVADTLTISDGTLTVEAITNTEISLVAESLTISDGTLSVSTTPTITLQMLYDKLLEIETLLANHSGPIGNTEEVVLTTDYAQVGLYWDGSQYQVI